MLTVGDFDERVFLGADADVEIGTPRKIVRDSSTCPKNAQQHLVVESNIGTKFLHFSTKMKI